MALPSALAILLDRARAEAKRHGHPATKPVHVAAALRRQQASLCEAEFPHMDTALSSLLQAISPTYGALEDDPETLRILDEAAAEPDPLRGVIDRLRPLIGSVAATSGSATQEPVSAAMAAPRPEERSSRAEPTGGLARCANPVLPDNTIVGRETLVDQLIGLLGRRRPATPLLVGTSGVGRTALLSALAARLNQSDYSGPLAGRQLMRVCAESVVAAQRSATLRELAHTLDNRSDVDMPIVAIDDLEVIAALGGDVADRDMLGVIRALVGNERVPLLLIIGSQYQSRLAVYDTELTRQLVPVQVPLLDQEALLVIAKTRAGQFATYHSVELPDNIVELAAAPLRPNSDRTHPAMMLERLDAACARAAIRAAHQVTKRDLDLGEEGADSTGLDVEGLIERLNRHVIGQDQAIASVSTRLALTRAKLDLQPARPDGVFLFVGPTGVGKTALALAIAVEVFGDPTALIRLDMSEYAQEWALSRLIGPQPGYVGFTEPESWLTTRVHEKPDCVVLLDEIEKAHPTIWNAFLQVFDAGRLTDSRGTVADFASCVVIMTSNLGGRSFQRRAIGFGDQGADGRPDQEIIGAVTAAMPPELVNRLDQIAVFYPLDRAAIRAIADKEIERALDVLARRGYDVRVSPEAVDLIADSGYDPAFGARHVQRSIERHLLQTLVRQEPGSLEALVVDGAISWVPR
ncbi:MAG TPA: AAA family ATPase [Acidimicrobiia bacterium]|nr:AAA family ATPase [Acidimicrobiia bacterium]